MQEEGGQGPVNKGQAHLLDLMVGDQHRQTCNAAGRGPQRPLERGLGLDVGLQVTLTAKKTPTSSAGE